MRRLLSLIKIGRKKGITGGLSLLVADYESDKSTLECCIPASIVNDFQTDAT